MKQKKIILISIIVILVIIVGSIVIYSMGPPYRNIIKCKNDCIKDGWEGGKCQWPKLMNEAQWEFDGPFPYSEIENRGSCVVAFLGVKSKHCGNPGQCNCYCFNYK